MIKKIAAVFAITSISIFSSCNVTDTPQSDAEKVCDCISKSKGSECIELQSKIQQKYIGNLEKQGEFLNTLSKCMSEAIFENSSDSTVEKTAEIIEQEENSNVEIDIKKFEDNVKGDNIFSNLESNEKLVALDISILNKSENLLSINPILFKITDTEDREYTSELVGKQPQVSLKELKKDKQLRGWITFKVPKDFQPKELSFSTGIIDGETITKLIK
jgi:hypothetical protein